MQPADENPGVPAPNNDPPHNPPKKKVGRPPKQMVAAPINIMGIIPQPINPNHCLELTYHNPMMFKNIMDLYKKFNVSELELIFDPTCLKISAVDHLEKSVIKVCVFGERMDTYYCAQTMRVCVKRENLGKVLSKLNNKDHKSISFVLKTENHRSAIYIIIKSAEYNTTNCYVIDVTCAVDVMPPVGQFCDDDYPVKFRMSSKSFKTLISHIRELSPVLSVEKVGNSPLRFTHPKAQGVNCERQDNDVEKMEMKCTLGEEEMLVVNVAIDHIRPYSGMVMGDYVHIAIDQQKHMSFTSYLDRCNAGWACIIKIFTTVNGR